MRDPGGVVETGELRSESSVPFSPHVNASFPSTVEKRNNNGDRAHTTNFSAQSRTYASGDGRKQRRHVQCSKMGEKSKSSAQSTDQNCPSRISSLSCASFNSTPSKFLLPDSRNSSNSSQPAFKATLWKKIMNQASKQGQNQLRDILFCNIKIAQLPYCCSVSCAIHAPVRPDNHMLCHAMTENAVTSGLTAAKRRESSHVRSNGRERRTLVRGITIMDNKSEVSQCYKRAAERVEFLMERFWGSGSLWMQRRYASVVRGFLLFYNEI